MAPDARQAQYHASRVGATHVYMLAKRQMPRSPITIAGPESIAGNTITHMEAQELYRLLGNYLRGGAAE